LLRPPVFVASPVLRALPGPQADHFTPAALDAFFRKGFTVSRDLDRMGMRLEGPGLEHKGSADIVSDATVPGAVQVPGSSQPILLLNDCQTTGGYPKIAVVISADLSSAGRLLPGAEIHFRKVTMTEAEEAMAVAEHFYRRIAQGLVPVRSL
jgi:allophanate hydrolase